MRYRGKWLLSLAALCSAAMVGPEVFAQGNYQSLPHGGRSALMGGTGVALGRDGSAPLLNPAGVLRIRERSVALSSRLFHLRYRTLKDWRQPGAIDEARFGDVEIPDPDATELDLEFLPTSTCYFEDFGAGSNTQPTSFGGKLPPPVPGHHQFAFCVVETENHESAIAADHVQATGSLSRIDLSGTRLTEWSRRNIGLAWAIDISQHFTVGISTFAVITDYDATFTGTEIVEPLDGTAASAASSQRSVSAVSWDLIPEFGALWRATNTLTVGVSIRAPGVHLLDSVDTVTFVDGLDGSTFQSVGSGRFYARLPARLALGLGYEGDRLRFEANGFFYAPEDQYAFVDVDQSTVLISPDGTAQRTAGPAQFSDAARPVANVAVGVEYFFTDYDSILAGATTDFSALAPFGARNLGARVLDGHRDAYHVSIGYGSYGELGEFLIGPRFTYASGEIRALDQLSQNPGLVSVAESEFAVTLTLAGRVHLSTAIEAAREVLPDLK